MVDKKTLKQLDRMSAWVDSIHLANRIPHSDGRVQLYFVIGELCLLSCLFLAVIARVMENVSLGVVLALMTALALHLFLSAFRLHAILTQGRRTRCLSQAIRNFPALDPQHQHAQIVNRLQGEGEMDLIVVRQWLAIEKVAVQKAIKHQTEERKRQKVRDRKRLFAESAIVRIDPEA